MFFKTELISKRLSIFFFNNPNHFSYNLFNFFFRIFFFKYSNNEQYKKSGCIKINAVPEKYISRINNEINLQNAKNHGLNTFLYKNTNELDSAVKTLIFDNLLNQLKDIQGIYGSSIKFSNYHISRNYHFDYSSAVEEYYASNFHTDNYTFLLIKAFINLHDVTEHHGPLEFIKKENKSHFLKKYSNSLKNFRLKKNDNLTDYFISKNTGKVGDVFFCNTTEALHRASVPSANYHRDMLFLEFVICPYEGMNHDIFSLENKYSIYYKNNNSAAISRLLAKPKTIVGLIIVMLKFIYAKIT